MKLTDEQFFVFDFDGVLCDSTSECMVTSWNAWQRWTGGADFRRTPEDFDSVTARAFTEMRPRVRGAGEYLVLHRVLNEGMPIASDGDYVDLVHEWRNELPSFAELFFHERDALRENDLIGWLALHPPFKAVVDFALRASARDVLAIATLKDKDSVGLLLESWGVVLDANKILARDRIDNKVSALDLIARERHLEPKQITFVDDNCNHLIDPHSTGYLAYQSTWGNVLPECLTRAHQNGIPCLTELDLEAWL